MKIRKGDKVKVISGKDKGKISSVLRVLPDRNQLVVEGVGVVKRHVKPGTISKEGGIVNVEKAISASNVMYYDDKGKKTLRIGYKVIDGKKYRINKKTGDVLDKKL